MKISLSKLLMIFFVGLSALPVIAMAALILIMNSDIRAIAENEFDKIGERNATQLAADIREICSIIQNSRDASIDNARKLLLSRLAELGHASFSDASVEAEITNQNDPSDKRVVKIPELSFGKEKVKFVLDSNRRIVSSEGKVRDIFDTLKSDTGMEFALLVRVNEAGDMLRAVSTVEDSSGGRYIGNFIPATGGEGSQIVRSILSKRGYSGSAYSKRIDFATNYEPVIGNNGNVIGAVCYGFKQNSHDYVLKYLEDARFGASGFVWAIELTPDDGAVWRISKDGKLNSTSVESDGVDDRRTAVMKIIAEAVNAPDGKIGSKRYKVAESGWDGDITSVYTYFKPWNMVIGVSFYKSDSYDAMARISRAGERFIFFLLPIGILMLGFSAFTARLATDRGKEMTGGLVEASNMIRDGNLRGAREALSELTDPDRLSNSEIFALCVALEKMTGYLSKLVWQVQSGGASLAAGAVKISEGAAEIESIAVEKAGALKNVSKATESISSSVELLKSKARRAAANIVASVNGICEGEQYLSNLTENASGLLSATESVASRLSIIQEKTDGISSAVTTVNTVSQRTNLLSLNASIEAEKAGEFGGGFAIVASEIGKLADMTAVSAMNISKMVSDMRDSVESGVVEMRSFVILMRRSLRVMDRVSDNMRAVSEQVAAVGPKFEELAGGVETQADRAARISKTMYAFSESAAQTRDKIGAFKAATDSLEKTAEQLRSKLSQFKLPKIKGDGENPS